MGNWKKIYTPLIAVFFGSFFLSAIIWKWCGKDFNFSFDSPLNFDFYTTFCGTLGIAGLGLAIWQIAELKTRQEEIAAATKKELDKMRNLEDVIRISKFKETIARIKTLLLDRHYTDVDPILAELREELHRCKDICPQKESEISSTLQQIYSIQASVNNVRLSAGNNIDTAPILVVMDDARELLGFIVDVCKKR